MKKLTTLVILTILLTQAANATSEQSPWSGFVAVKSLYLGSNSELLCNKAVTQGSISYAVNDKVILDLWGSRDFNTEHPSNCKEVDYTIIYKPLPSNSVSISYFDIADIGSFDNPDIISVKYTHIFEKIWLKAQFIDPSGGNFGYDLTITHPLNDNLKVGASTGATPFAQDEYFSPMIEYSHKINATSSISIKYQTSITGPAQTKNNLVLSLMYSF